MRTIVLSFIAAFALTGAAPATDDHAIALAAVGDIASAIGEIVRIEDGAAVGRPAYAKAAHRALNALVGKDDEAYVRTDGDPGDGNGALGNVDRLLDRTGESVWTPALQGAKANLLAAVQNLHDALGEKQMEDYQADLTQAMANLALVVGRPSQTGVLGGLAGALGNTTLGVPAGAASADVCAVPRAAPVYGVSRGRLIYVALPRAAASTAIPPELSVSRVVVTGDAIRLYTRAAAETPVVCAHHERLSRTRRVVVASGAAAYTAAQARAGSKVYAQSCVSCHGANLQGTAAPAVAGTEFVKQAQGNKWTLADVHTLVTQNMPLNNPGSLTKAQYASVMAFLLASNCYPAGTKAFPQDATPAFAKLKLVPQHGAKPNALGVCALK